MIFKIVVAGFEISCVFMLTYLIWKFCYNLFYLSDRWGNTAFDKYSLEYIQVKKISVLAVLFCLLLFIGLGLLSICLAQMPEDVLFGKIFDFYDMFFSVLNKKNVFI